MKARVLPLRVKQQIFKYKQDYPNSSAREIAEKFKCTQQQVYNYLRQGKKGLLKRVNERLKSKPLKDILSIQEPDSLLENQYKFAVAQLETNFELGAETRIALLDKLLTARKTLQQVKLEGHIKRADSQIIALIIRRYEPDATDEKIIQVYREEMERWKVSQK